MWISGTQREDLRIKIALEQLLAARHDAGDFSPKIKEKNQRKFKNQGSRFLNLHRRTARRVGIRIVRIVPVQIRLPIVAVKVAVRDVLGSFLIPLLSK